MQSQSDQMEMLERIMSETNDMGLAACRAEDERTSGRRVRIDGRDLTHFGSCSYLGLELDPRLIEGAIDALRAHGTETSSSRSYLTGPLYLELESLLTRIFQAHVVVAPTTTLGHLAALPTLVDSDHAIVMDHQVHSSVQMACRLVQGNGTAVEIVRHNDLEKLEERVADLSRRHSEVWYMADGVYSMFGDLAPVGALREMLDRHPQMRFYVDDAHGMSWCGPRGSGTVLGDQGLHPRMVLATGLAKGFGTGGGLIVLPEEAQRRRVQTCGPTLIFGGPIQPPILGAAIASARIHLSDEIVTLQRELRDRMELCDRLFQAHDLPVISSPDTPVGFVGTGPTAACQNLCRRLQEDGLYTNPAQFPAAPARRSGGRFLLTRHHREEDIERLVDAYARHWEPAVREAGSTPEEVWRAFGLEPPAPRPGASWPRHRPAASKSSLYLESASSIEKLRPEEWDALMADRGCLGSRALAVFERCFGPDAEPHNRWQFRYYVVRDEEGAPVLATCFTASLWKADMLAPAAVSREVERLRAEDPSYLTQRVFAMGCLLSEGDQLWLREPASSETSRAALRLLLAAVRSEAKKLDCGMLVLRDVPSDRTDLAGVLEAEGLLRMDAPDSLVLEGVPTDDEALVAGLSRDHRRHQRRDVRPWDDAYLVEVAGVGGRPLHDGEADVLHRLYENVKGQSLDLNTFELPQSLLPALAESPGWEIVILRSSEDPTRGPVGFFVGYTAGSAYVPLFAGLDYVHVSERGLYRQVLRQAIGRARTLGRDRVLFGFGASLEKRRFGARPEAGWMFVEIDDHYTLDALSQIAAGAV